MSRTKTADMIEEHFRRHRYESFTTLDLMVAFPEVKLETIRNAIRALSKERIIKATGMIRHSDKFAQPQPIADVYCLTLTIGK